MSSKKAVFEARDPAKRAGDTIDSLNKGVDTLSADTFSLEPLADADAGCPEGVRGEASVQVAEKASFYAPDPELETPDSSARGKKKKYSGVERRRTNRRSGGDRRTDVRFDLDSTDRRQIQGRREDDKTPKYW